ncbi:hypothetical protein HG530_014550 [Fusarium avenaceum]|nr:hypothetical protein HG530_014550 [Fusarium avenaceum]
MDKTSTTLADGVISNKENQHSDVAAFREAIEHCDFQSLDSILAVDKTFWDTPFELTLVENGVKTVLKIPPLTLMTAKTKSSIVQLLLKHGAPVNTEIQNIGGTALHMAARLGTVDIAKILLDFHAKIDQQDGSGSFICICPFY